MIRLATRVVVIIACVLACPTTSLATTPGVQFVGGDVTVPVSAGVAGDFSVTVINGSSSAESLTFWSAPSTPGTAAQPVVGLSADAAHPTAMPKVSASAPPSAEASPASGPASQPPGASALLTLAPVGAGDVVTIQAHVEPVTASTSFALIVTSTDGSTATETISLALKTASASASPPPDVIPISTPMPATIVMGAVVLGVPTHPTVYVDPAVVSRVTPLFAPDGQGVEPAYNASTGQVSIPQLPGAGKYTGSIVGTDGKAAAALELDVRHGLVIPILVLLLGLFAGYLTQAWLKLIRPGWVAEVGFERLRRRALDAIGAERARLVSLGAHAIVDPPVPVAVYVDPGPSWLGTQLALAEDAVLRAGAEDRAKAVGDQLDALEGIVASQRALWVLGDAIRDVFWRIHRRLPAGDQDPFRQGAVEFELREAMRGRALETKDAFDAVTTSWNALLGAVRTLDDLVDELELLERNGVPPSTTGPLYARLARLSDVTGDPVTQLATAIRSHWPGGSPGVEGPVTGLVELAAAQDGKYVMVDAWLDRPVATPQPTARTGIRQRLSGRFGVSRADPASRLDTADKVYFVAIIVVTLLTGLNTNYAPNATFGSLGNYVTLFLWGFTAELIGELVKGAWGRLSALG